MIFGPFWEGKLAQKSEKWDTKTTTKNNQKRGLASRRRCDAGSRGPGGGGPIVLWTRGTQGLGPVFWAAYRPIAQKARGRFKYLSV